MYRNTSFRILGVTLAVKVEPDKKMCEDDFTSTIYPPGICPLFTLVVETVFNKTIMANFKHVFFLS